MKKLLLASTAVVVFAGGAMAEVVVGGSGRIGIVDNGSDTLFNSRIRITFAASSESDSGLAFGGSIRADNAANGNAGTAGSVFVSGAFGKLSMGDVDGAAEAAVGNLSGVGYVGNGDFNEAIYLSNDKENPTALYEYSASGFTVYLSMANPVDVPKVVDAKALGNDEYAIGVKYAVDNYTVALGFESENRAAGTVTHVIAGASAAFGGATIKAQYGESSDLDMTQYGASIDYTFGATTVTAFAREQEVGTVSNTYMGLGFGYDLGGGAAIKGGIVDPDSPTVDYRADLGITFSF